MGRPGIIWHVTLSAGTQCEQRSHAALIMQIISILGLAILLVTGIAAASHLEGGQAPSHTATSALPNSAMTHAATAESSSDAPAASEREYGSLSAGALCILGALGGLILALALRGLLRRRTLVGLLAPRRELPFRLSMMRDLLPRTTGPSLSQLGLSRT